ncbi:MAG: hypothetical protein J0M12_07765 [Deltaproteobacteria bacterium]|nr:hypothetical protein [Deltaproteobacteria bacterium]
MKLKALVAVAVCTLIVSALFGCAGGTRGSGVGSIEGRVVYLDGPAISDVVVEALDQAGVQDITDQNGSFTLTFDGVFDPSSLPPITTLQLNGNQISATVSVTTPDESSDIIVTITINPQTNDVSEVEETSAPRPTATPSPTPVITLAPTATPPAGTTRTPTPRPGETITRTPTPEATTTGLPTRTPTPGATPTIGTRTPTPTPTTNPIGTGGGGGGSPTRTPTPTRTPR